MRIFSDFLDYYDSVQAYGQDSSLIYVRKRMEKEYKWNHRDGGDYPLNLSKFEYLNRDMIRTQIVVGFCGKLYPAMETWAYYNHSQLSPVRESKICFSAEEVINEVSFRLKGRDLEKYEKGQWFKGCWDYPSVKKINSFFDSYKNAGDKLLSLFVENKAPIFIGRQEYLYSREPKITFNDRLIDLDFVRIVPPFEAFQAITTFMDNMGRPEPYVPTPTDRQMLEIKGFDKFSFKTPPSKRK